LVSEPIVAVFALYAALLWGLVFLTFVSVPLIFAEYNWSTGPEGLIFLTIIIGAAIGVLVNRIQDSLFRRDAAKTIVHIAPPESRLYMACIGAVVIPFSLFMLAWTGRDHITWIAPAIALIIFNAGVYPIYLAIFTYLADSYSQYSSSALAAQSFLRNVFAGTFPLFGPAMYHRLGNPGATSLLAGLTAIFAPVPFLLYCYGASIRRKSRIAKRIARQEELRILRHTNVVVDE